MSAEKNSETHDAETAYGGADAVEKTSYLAGSGTDPEDRRTAHVSARAEPGGGANPIAWLAIALLVLVGVVYLLGFLG